MNHFEYNRAMKEITEEIKEKIVQMASKGMSRKRICANLKVTPDIVHACLGVNTKRHIKSESRRELVRQMKKQGMSYRQIGEKLGVSPQRAQQLLSWPRNQYHKERRLMHEKADYRCEWCGTQTDHLNAHHEDYDQSATVLICVSCHTRHHLRIHKE